MDRLLREFTIFGVADPDLAADCLFGATVQLIRVIDLYMHEFGAPVRRFAAQEKTTVLFGQKLVELDDCALAAELFRPANQPNRTDTVRAGDLDAHFPCGDA